MTSPAHVVKRDQQRLIDYRRCNARPRAQFNELLWLTDWVAGNLPRGAWTIYREYPHRPSKLGLLWTIDGDYVHVPDRKEPRPRIDRAPQMGTHRQVTHFPR